MKATTLLGVAALVGGGLYLMRRSAHAASSRGGQLGDINSDGSGSSMVPGSKSGQLYPVGFGAAGPGGTLYSVFNPADPSVLLFTYVDAPSTGAQVSRSLTARNPEAPEDRVNLGLQDFGFLS